MTTATDQILKRMLVLNVRNILASVLDDFVDSDNNETNRTDITETISEILKPLVNDYVVCCDKTNNTPIRVENRRIYADVAFQQNENEPWVYIHGHTPGKFNVQK